MRHLLFRFCGLIRDGEQQRCTACGDKRDDNDAEARGNVAQYRQIREQCGKHHGKDDHTGNDAVLFCRRQDDGNEHTVDRDAERVRQNGRQNVACRRAECRAEHPARNGDGDEPIAVKR